jgi:hypothetical protein
MENDKFEIKITSEKDGSKTDLSNLTLKESKALVTILEAVTKIVELSAGAEKLKIQITKGSASVSANGDSSYIEEIQQGFTEVKEFRSTDSDLVDPWRKIQDLISLNGLSYEASFFSKGKKRDILPEISGNRRFYTQSKIRTTSYTLEFLKGQLIEIGGKVPNIHIIDKDLQNLTVHCKDFEAQRVNGFLYKDIYLSAWKTTKDGKPFKYNFCDFYKEVSDFEEYKSFFEDKNLHLLDNLKNIHYKICAFLEKKEFMKVRQFIKLFNHESVDNSVLKTILIITKSHKDISHIADVRNNIKLLLEKKRGAKLV